ncbi:MAG TPA: VOC family protein [Candidatus Limnocylindrales bacterium]|nr:VOC family protein [Candidatus Limnocylindrales bacterium]
MRLFRVIVPVAEIDAAARFYEHLLGLPGKRVSSGRHYIDCEGTILALFSPREDTDPWDAKPNPEPIYFAVDDLEAVQQRALGLDAHIDDPIAVQPWGERSFYLRDPYGNRLCMVDRRTLFTG